MATLNGLTASQAYWYAVNWNQMLGGILYGGGASSDNLDLRGFRYTNDDKDETTEPYADVTVSGVENRHGLVPGNTFHYTSAYALPDDVEEIVLCLDFSPGNFGVDSQLVIDDRYGLGFYYLWNYPVAWFKTVYRKTDGTVSTLGADGVHEMVLNYLPGGVNSGITANGQDYMPRDANGYLWMSRGEPNKYSKVSFKCSHKVFETQRDAELYLKYGIDKSLEELGDEEPEEPTEETATNTYYYDVQTSYFNDMGLTDMTSQNVSRLHVTFTDYPVNEYDATTHTSPIIARVGTNNKVSFIIHNGFGEYITDAWYQYGNIKIPITTSVVATIMGLNDFKYGQGYDTGVDKYTVSHVSTNMPVIGADGSAVPLNPTSDEMLANTNSNNFDVGLSECWVLSKSNMIELAQVFNTTVDRTATGSGEYVVAEWITGLSAYSSPLDVICDLFALPISIDGFCETTADAFSFNS